VGVVDVYAIRPACTPWQVLTLKRAAAGTRCPNAWETVAGRMEAGERPDTAALRELHEETGLVPDRLYSITVQPFWLHRTDTVQLAVVFAAFVAEPGAVTLGPEHQAYEWLPVDAARARFAWPRERATLDQIVQLLGTGGAGPLEDVLRVR
jgi:8-oxo-dGTP pyrophosphatase MutT (NUDIX family)